MLALVVVAVVVVAVVVVAVKMVPRRDVGREVLGNESACEPSGSPQLYIEALRSDGGHVYRR